MQPIVLVASSLLGCAFLQLGCGGGATGGTSSDPPGAKAPPDGSAEAEAGGTGTTPCGVSTCQANQYCDNLLCRLGCLSETNCTSAQICQKSGSEDVGSCQVKAPVANPAAACDRFAAKLEVCQPREWSSLVAACTQAKGRACTGADVCNAMTSACIDCFNAAPTCGDAAGCTATCR